MYGTSWMHRVQEAFKLLLPRVRKKLDEDAQRAPDGVYRMRCKIIRNLVRGICPVAIAEVLECSDPHASKIHLILDNYRIHKSERTRLALLALEDRVELHFLSPYCPDHNKIERVWKDLHANVTRNHRCKDMNELMREVNKYLRRHDAVKQKQYAERRAA